MNTNDASHFLGEFYKKIQIQIPTTYLVLGSGFASALSTELMNTSWILRGTLPFTDLPGLPPATVHGHRGMIQYFEHHETKKSLAIQVGRLHGYEGHAPQLVVHSVMATLLAGTSRFYLTNAAGGLSNSFEIGSLMLIQDHFNFTGQNPLVGPNPVDQNGKPIGPRFPDFSAVYDPEIRKRIKLHFSQLGLSTFEGIYLGLLGPSFETPAEISIFSKWGAHAVGMSTIWEAIALKHAGAKIAGISLISNLACGLGAAKPLEHEEILTQCALSANKNLKGLLSFIESEFLENEDL